MSQLMAQSILFTIYSTLSYKLTMANLPEAMNNFSNIDITLLKNLLID